MVDDLELDALTMSYCKTKSNLALIQIVIKGSELFVIENTTFLSRLTSRHLLTAFDKTAADSCNRPDEPKPSFYDRLMNRENF